MEVGLRLFAERGFESTTIADIAREAGVAHGLVYHYFRSKDELLHAVFEGYSFLPALRHLLTVAPTRPASAVLPEIAVGFSAMLDERADFMRLVVRESQTNVAFATALAGVANEGLELLTEYINGRVAVGELRPHDVTVTARAIFHAIIASHLAGVPPRDFPAGLVDVILRGVLAADGTAPDHGETT